MCVSETGVCESCGRNYSDDFTPGMKCLSDACPSSETNNESSSPADLSWQLMGEEDDFDIGTPAPVPRARSLESPDCESPIKKVACMQLNFFDVAAIHPAPSFRVDVRCKPVVPVKTLKCYNPNAKKFYWDGARFGVISMGEILWLKFHKGKRFNSWLPDVYGEQPESYSEHLFKDAHTFTVEAISKC